MKDDYKPILVGQIDKVKVYFEYGEYLKTLKFAKAGASDGSRGVLLGRRDGENIYVLRVLEALYCGGEGIETPTFSPDSWGRIDAEIKDNFSGLSLLGQFCSHKYVSPERNDYIMQEKYFGNESNLLYIFDPTENSEKMYIYKDREFNFLNGFYLFDKFEKSINLSLREAIVRPLTREYELRVRMFDDIKKKIKTQKHIYAVVWAIITLLIIYNSVRLFELEKRIGNIKFPDREKTEWKIELNN